MADAESSNNNQWKTLDKDLKRWVLLEQATQSVARPYVAIGVALIFVILTGLATAAFSGAGSKTFVMAGAAVLGAYMALNIGANDVANNMGPAVGANALTMGGALIIAAVFETAGALIAGSDVVATISSGIVDPAAVAEPTIFIRAMLASLIAASLWLNIATWLGAPVSTTHAIVGGVAGAGIVAAGFGAINWSTMQSIIASWVISPFMGGILAALLLAFIRVTLNNPDDKIAAARFWVPILVGIMAGTFSTYLAMKGLQNVLTISLGGGLALGVVIGIAFWAIFRPIVRRQSRNLPNHKHSLKPLFSIPLIAAAALLSFAHGANDVANAVGPLAAIVHTVQNYNTVGGSVTVPLWVMLIGAFGISFGLLLFGPRLIRMVGQEITKLNQMRAWCVALSAAVTVIIASALGLPVSSTHIAVGGVFGVGFYREWDAERRARKRVGVKDGRPPLTSEERQRRKLVRRSHVLSIAAAWVITVPLTALLSAFVFWLLTMID